MPRTHRWVYWPVIAVLMLLVIGSCGLLGFTTCNPRDRVRVFVENIPPDTRFLSLAAKSDRGVECMEWSPEHLWSKLKMHPKDCIWSYRDAWEPSQMEGYPVWWRSGDKYGVVMQTNKGEWRVAWFPAAEVPVRGRNWLGGEGQVELDLSKAEIVPLDAETVRALGLQDVKPMK